MRAKRIDANQREIVDTFRSLGATVYITSSVGKGFPDIVVGIFGKNYIFEIKDGSKMTSAQGLTKFEEAFFRGWKGQCDILYSIEDVLAFMRKLHYGKFDA